MALYNGPQDATKSFKELKESLNAPSIANFSTEEFNEKITQLTTSCKALLQGGIQVNNGEDILSKLDAIMLIFELSIATENLPADDKKRESIQSLQDNTLADIIKSINTINQNADRWCNPKEFPGLDILSYRSAHQRLLMINSLLFYYAGTLHKNKIIQTFSERFITFPLRIEPHILKKSKAEANHRTSKPSYTEKTMINCFLQDPLYSSTSQFSAIKENASQTYIEPDTGLELDFPLVNHITIELDGDEFHFINGKPKLDHLRKEKQLLENGWNRISLSTSMLKKYGNKMPALITAVSETLNSAPVGQYLEMHKFLTRLRSDLREKINILHVKLKDSVGVVSVGQGVQIKAHRQSQSQKKKKANLLFSESASSLNASALVDSPLSQQLRDLLELENKISGFLLQNHLDKIINNHALHTIIDVKFKLYGEIHSLSFRLDKSKDQIPKAIRDIRALEKRLKLNSYPQKSKCAEWIKQQCLIDVLKKEQDDLYVKISDCKEKIKTSEQKLITLLSSELHLDELSSLNEEVAKVIHPSEIEIKQVVKIQANPLEEKVSSSSKMKV